MAVQMAHATRLPRSGARRRTPLVPVAAILLTTVLAACSGSAQGSLSQDRATSEAAPPAGTASDERSEPSEVTGPQSSQARPAGVPADTQRAVVERVVDGDTLWVRVDDEGGPLVARATHKIRLLLMDTPETQHPDKGKECWGPEASAFTARALPVGSVVYLESDTEDTDRYGRFLRYVWTDDGKLFNREAVRHGHAQVVVYQPNDHHHERLLAAERRARQRSAGMWGSPCHYDAAGRSAANITAGQAPQERATRSPAAAGAACDPNYTPCIPAYPPDLDCGGIGDLQVRVTGADPHNLDGDGDGIGCGG